MTTMLPDKTFYPSPTLAAEAPPEKLAYVALLAPEPNGNGTHLTDGLGVIDVAPGSPDYGRLVGKVDFPNAGNELHHFGWNACSSHLCGYAANPHIERRYLVVPGTHSSRIHIVDTRPDPRNPRLIKVIEGDEVSARTGYAAPHTVHCGPDGIYMNALGSPDGNGPGGIFMLDHETFEVKGAWERNRGPQQLAYDFWWHLGHDTMITSEWGTPNMVKNGVDPELLLNGKYGNALHVWDLKRRTHVKKLELGAEQQMVLELRPAHNPRKAYGFVGVVLSLADLSSSIWMWYRNPDTGEWTTRKIIQIPAEPADPADLPPLLQGFKAVPPLVSDINLSLDDRCLYVSCWGTGELRQYDVSDPMQPTLTGSVRIGGIVRRTAHPSNPEKALNGGPQMVEVSRDGKRVYVSNSLYTPWDAQFYPDGIRGWVAKLDAEPAGGIAFDPRFLVEFPDGLRPHQVRLEGGDASSDSFCYA
ncbi:MAG TPA: selenium-binding protein SBP56-related protein [Gemmatimonadaceae bacterium]|nr:selenium-binding protein SBP56-related protein [Gemmatimonadaceae bacterium]